MNDPSSRIFLDLNCQHVNYKSEIVCGDVFYSRKIESENRIVFVLSDGIGQGIKANVLANMTSRMAMNFAVKYKEPQKVADILMKVLPICEDRKMPYSTLSIVDIELGGKVSILELGSPSCLIFRGKELYAPEQYPIHNVRDQYGRANFSVSVFTPKVEDRLLIFSDGVIKSGLGTSKYPFGWGAAGVEKLVKIQVRNNPIISSAQLAAKVVNRSNQNDDFISKDDASCVSVYFRNPRKLLLCTGPPFERSNDFELAAKVRLFNGKRIICGATTAAIVARELEWPISDSFDVLLEEDEYELPPVSTMKNIDLVTEGILTLSKVSRILSRYDSTYQGGSDPAHQIVGMFLESDEIEFYVGTKINIAHQDPNLPMDLEIRRTVVKRIAHFLHAKLMKEVRITYC